MLSESQWKTLIAAMDRIIPADGDDAGVVRYPSASENGVAIYFERQFLSDLADALPVYRLGLDALDAEARIAFGEPFANLPGERQDETLLRVENGRTTADWHISSSGFFTMLAEHAAEGYYADPEHNGGNPAKASWAMIGFVERTGWADAV